MTNDQLMAATCPCQNNRRGHGTRTSRFILDNAPGRNAILAFIFAIIAATNALAQPASTATKQAVVTATPGLNGHWSRQQWAPLRLTLRNAGEAKSVDIFCDDGGPTFNVIGQMPAVPTRSFDIAIYAQFASTHWTVRITRPDGKADDFPIDLAATDEWPVRFDGWSGKLQGAGRGQIGLALRPPAMADAPRGDHPGGPRAPRRQQGHRLPRHRAEAAHRRCLHDATRRHLRPAGRPPVVNRVVQFPRRSSGTSGLRNSPSRQPGLSN